MNNHRFSLVAIFSVYLLIPSIHFGQTVEQKIQKAYASFEKDAQLKYAISSLYVVDANTGKVVFDKNSRIGLAPASTQKIITSVTAYELLGKTYKFKTSFSIKDETLFVKGYGDPTLGSWRFPETRDTFFFDQLIDVLKRRNVGNLKQIILSVNPEDQLLPGGWIYEDIGNYYGAGAYRFNWHENQYDVTFIPGAEGDMAKIDTLRTLYWKYIINNCKTGPAGSGDNAYIYFLPYGSTNIFVNGTIPAGVKRFSISGSDPAPNCSFSTAFLRYATARSIFKGDVEHCNTRQEYAHLDSNVLKNPDYIHFSPNLDSIIYYFNQRSINLYGEALVKAFSYEKYKVSSTDSGISIIKDFWKQKKLDVNEINISDGSGLSPQNRVTTHAQVDILKFAKAQEWFPSFYHSLPIYNKMKLKSGTINRVKAFAGYHKAKNGREYIISFIVNNYNGSASSLVNKMYEVLNVFR